MKLIVFFFMSIAAVHAVAGDAAPAATRRAQTTNRWRYVWHNDRWWYWTSDERWNYFDGRRWMNYDPRHLAAGALAASYHKSPAFETPPAVTPSPPGSWPVPAVQREAALSSSFSSGLDGSAQLRSRNFAEGQQARERGTAGERLRGLSDFTRPRPPRAGGARTGGGGFGGPRGTSLGAGSAAGGGSSPQ